MNQQLITVFGGSGFIGRYLVSRLAKLGMRIRVAVRRPDLALFLKPLGDVGQIQLVPADITHAGSIRAALDGADAAINLVGILFESRRRKFTAIHGEGPATLARIAAELNLGRLIHTSALGAEKDAISSYARSKALGEAGLLEAFPQATIVRPSVVFGPEDQFFNKFAALARFSPILPLIGGGNTRFQPVYVGDVADAIVHCLGDARDTQSRIFELGGPGIYSLREIYELVLAETGRRRILLNRPFGLAMVDAWFLQWLPNPLLTVDQVKLLKSDNLVSAGARTLQDLGITGTSVEAIAPTYLRRYRAKGLFRNLEPA